MSQKPQSHLAMYLLAQRQIGINGVTDCITPITVSSTDDYHNTPSCAGFQATT